MEKYFIFKDKIMTLANQGMVTFDEDSSVFNIISIVSESFDEPNDEVKLGSIPSTKVKINHSFPMIIEESAKKN